ncbi:MAG: helix-hairpin-helix domain-containing protein [Actinomycetota bacterium]|nr:helix-hairpin-helix domain-containing protein [Actinomycetota bacterium]
MKEGPPAASPPPEKEVSAGEEPAESEDRSTAEAGDLSWRERRHVGRIARDAEKVALERLEKTREQLEQGLEARFSAATADAAAAMEARLEKAKSGFADLLGGARDTISELREQISEAGKQRAGLEASGAEIQAQTAAAEDTLRGATDKAIKDLTTQADERVKRMSAGVQEATDLAEGLRKEFSLRVDGAVQRVDRSSADLDSRAADLKRGSEELRDRLQSAGERAAALEQGIRDQIEKAISALRAEGDRQAQRLDARIEALEAQRAGLKQQSELIQKEGGAVREQAVELEELIKNATTEVATTVGAVQRELDSKLEASKALVVSVADDREQEQEQWEQMRERVADELDRTAGEIREFFLVQLAGVRSRVEAIAEASGLAAPSISDPEGAFADWIPSRSMNDQNSGNVDLNSAGISELRALDLTITQARRLIEHRERVGGFTSVDQVDEIPGFTPDQRAGVKRRTKVS